MKKSLLSGLAVFGLLVAVALVTGCTEKSSGVTQPAGGPKPITSEAGAGTAGGGTTEAAPGPSVETPTLPD